MKRVLCLLMIAIVSVTVVAQRGQDFASRFVQQCNEDTTLKCVTVSPKMMEQLVNMGGDNRNDTLMTAIAKLKSARIVQAETNGEHYYQKAEALLKKNAGRFSFVKTFRTERSEGVFYNRQKRSGKVVELVMVCKTTDNDMFVLVNLTGDIDEEFIEFLCFLYK